MALGMVGTGSDVLDTCHDNAHHIQSVNCCRGFPCSMNKKSWNVISPCGRITYHITLRRLSSIDRDTPMKRVR